MRNNMLLEGITLEEANEIMSNYTGPSSSVLYTAEYLKNKSDRVAKLYFDNNLGKLCAEINCALITASDEGEYSVTIQKSTLEKYKLIVIRAAIDKLKEVGYKVEASITYRTIPETPAFLSGIPIIYKILIKWD